VGNSIFSDLDEQFVDSEMVYFCVVIDDRLRVIPAFPRNNTGRRCYESSDLRPALAFEIKKNKTPLNQIHCNMKLNCNRNRSNLLSYLLSDSFHRVLGQI